VITAIVVIVILVVFGLVAISTEKQNQNEIRNWATENRYTIVSMEQTVFDQGPYGWLDGGKGVSFYKVVVKKYGKMRTFWFRFGFTTEVREENGQ
jgi:hypothetical protein